MFRRSPVKSLRLSIDGQVHHFPSLPDFEYALAGRTGIPVPRLITLLGQSNRALLRDAELVRRIAVRLTHVVSAGAKDSPNVSAFLTGFDLVFVSEDHGWRSIFASLAHYDASIDEYKHLALVKYGQYLSSLEEATRAVFTSRRSGYRSPDPGPDPDGIKNTVVIYTGDVDVGHDHRCYTRLPKGEAVEVALAPGDNASLLLVKHQCALLGGSPPSFIDPQGRRTELRSGKIVVGRDARSDIRLITKRRDVSRKHLIMEVLEGDVVRLTDISSLGSFIASSCLERAAP